tara:strand:+ start:457 stop:654 length:198 start_codon:yes stop_codon:yes gene_type:complete
MTKRHHLITQKVETNFGSMFIHIDFNDNGQPVAGWISDKGKDPDSAIVGLIEALSEGLNKVLKIG